MAGVGTDPVGEVHAYRIQGLEIKTGDLICTTDGGRTVGPGQFWWLVGKLIPGDVDHIAVYVGPQGRCVEAGAKGRVVAFEVAGETWDATAMLPFRGFEDVLYGAAYPLAGRAPLSGAGSWNPAGCGQLLPGSCGQGHPIQPQLPRLEHREGILLQPARLQGLPPPRHRPQHGPRDPGSAIHEQHRLSARGVGSMPREAEGAIAITRGGRFDGTRD